MFPQQIVFSIFHSGFVAVLHKPAAPEVHFFFVAFQDHDEVSILCGRSDARITETVFSVLPMFSSWVCSQLLLPWQQWVGWFSFLKWGPGVFFYCRSSQDKPKSMHRLFEVKCLKQHVADCSHVKFFFLFLVVVFKFRLLSAFVFLGFTHFKYGSN